MKIWDFIIKRTANLQFAVLLDLFLFFGFITPFNRALVGIPTCIPTLRLAFRFAIDGQVTATRESLRIDRGHAFGNNDVCQAPAVIERIIAD